MKLKQHGLSLFFGAAFLVTIAAQSFVGLAAFNEEQIAFGKQAVTWGVFVTSSAFVVDVAENWQSEYLQFFLFILTTVWLVQKGSPESKLPGDEGLGTESEQLLGKHAHTDSPAWARASGWKRWVFSNSLLLVMGAIFVFSWLAQALAGVTAYNSEQDLSNSPHLTFGQYLVSPDFWNRTLQNWQSELLAVGTMVAFSIYLRQRGSAESKPVGAPHHETAITPE